MNQTGAVSTMNWGHRALTPLLLGVLIGTAWQLSQPVLWPKLGYGAVLIAGLLLGMAAFRWGQGRWRVLWAVAAVLATFALCGIRASEFAEQALSTSAQGRDVRVQGTIVAMPQSSDIGQRFRFAPTQAMLEGRPLAVPPLWELTWYAPREGRNGPPTEEPPPLRAGQHWEFTVRLKAPHGARNPYGFDYELWLWEQGVQATGYVQSNARETPPRLLQSTKKYPIEQWRQSVRDAIVQRLAQAVALDVSASERLRAARAAGVVAALVTGDQRAIDRSDWDLFRATGVAHLMSISGLHITLFAAVARALVGWLWRRSPRLCLFWPAPDAALWGGLLLAAGYALFSGWGIPAQRTMWMLTTVVLLRLGGLRWPWPVVWLLACALVLLYDPYALWQAGFWLSFVAVGILFASDFVIAHPPRPHPDSNVAASVQMKASAQPLIWRVGYRHLAKFLREQWVVTVALTPLTLLLFGQISVVGVLANALAIPWVTLVVTPLALLGVVWGGLWEGAAASMVPLVEWLQWLATWPGAVWTLPAAPLWAALGALAGGVCLVLRWPWQWRILGTVFFLPVLLWQPERPAVGAFSLLAADVGQGSAVLVQTAQHALLYDAGPRYGLHSSAGERVLVPLLRALGVRLDRVVLSHSDTDHTGGAAAIAATQPGAQWLGGGATSAHAHVNTHARIRPLWPAGVPPIAPCHAGLRWQWDGVDFEVLHPAAALEGAGVSAVSSNALSCVLRITSAQGHSALLVGDIERPQEQALLAAGAPLKAEVVLVPHHGSKTSSSSAFVQAVAARYALVQAGWRNQFGHPAPRVVQRWQGVGATVVDSPTCGAAWWYSDRATQMHCERQSARHYWQHLNTELD